MDTITMTQAADLISSVGHLHTVLVQGELGIGKSSMLKTLAAKHPDHTPLYVDLTTMTDSGDVNVPMIRDIDGTTVCRFAPNEVLGLHLDAPVLLMLDELGKCGKSLLNSTLRLMLERKLGIYTLPSGSIVFATTNLAAEGLGDVIPPHARNRIIQTRVAKPTADEWISWGLNAGIEPCVLAFANEFPQVFASYTEYETPDSNHYINDPRAQRTAFVTPRSMEAASNIIKHTRQLPETVLFHALCGTIGAPAAADMLAVLRLDGDLPSWKDIIARPDTIGIPKGGAAMAMLIYRALSRIDDTSFDAWVTYLRRLSKEAQALFARQIMSPTSGKLKLASTNREFVKLAVDLGYLFK